MSGNEAPELTPPWLRPKGDFQGVRAPKKLTEHQPAPALVPTTVEHATWAVEMEPTQGEKLRYEEFARQYIIDHNQTRAACRMGYPHEKASDVGNKLFWKPYTQAYLTVLIRSLEERAIVGRNQVLSGLLAEANNYGPDATSMSRIMAWKTIGQILGMFIAKVEISANSSGVMEVPMVRSVNEWEALASGSQQGLLEAART